MAYPVNSSLSISLPKKGNSSARTTELPVSSVIQVMLKVILNRLKPKASEIIAEEQAGFRARRSTTEQIFNFKILYEKYRYLQHQQDLYHVFTDLKSL